MLAKNEAVVAPVGLFFFTPSEMVFQDKILYNLFFFRYKRTTCKKE